MTIKTLSKQQVSNLKRIFHNAGIKLTHQRLEIYKVMTSVCDHPSAETIYSRLQITIPTIALDTIYRTLATFEKLGIVKKLDIIGERALFDANLEQHHHFVCNRCLAVHDIYWPEFDNSIFPDPTDVMALTHSRHIELRGICTCCIEEIDEQKIP